MFSLQKLGVITGVGRNAFNTTFGDMGALERDSHLRAAYANIEPTTIGFLAACLRVLRNPYWLHALTTVAEEEDDTVFAQLMALLGVNLAAVYGDIHTLRKLRAYLNRTLGRTFYAAAQPLWLYEATGLRRDFTLSENGLRRFFAITCSATIYRAHCQFLLEGTNDKAHGNGTMATINRKSVV